MRIVLLGVWRLIALLVFLAGSPLPACHSARAEQPTHNEVSTGGQAFRRAWSLYSGLTLAPFGDIQQDGWRIRLAGGVGRFRDERPGEPTLRFTTSFAELLLGYHKQIGSLTVKAFAGATAGTADLDAGWLLLGVWYVGAKLGVETWWDVNPSLWTSLDLSWTWHDRFYTARGRLGWRLSPAWSVGPEAQIIGDSTYDEGRVGVFARYEWPRGEVSASAGWSTNYVLADRGRPSDDTGSPYATVNWLTRF